MTPGTSQGMSMVRREKSEVCRKKRCFFLSLDGNTLIKVILIMILITVKQGYQILRISRNVVSYFHIFSGNRPCVFPFNYYGVSHDSCTLYRADDVDNDKVVLFILLQFSHISMFSPGAPQN